MKQLFTFLLLALCITTKAQSYCYTDKDGDGFGDPNTATPIGQFGCALSGSVTNGNDCDDNNASINPNTVWYKDFDNDGISDGTTKKQCTRPTGYKLASELTATSGDCNDNDPDVTSQVQKWWPDYDHDGYIWLNGGGEIDAVCRPGSDYISESKADLLHDDCAIYDPIQHPFQVWYPDLDGDGYPGSLTTITQCNRPAGYKAASELISTQIVDCDDNDKNVSPGNKWYLDADHDGYYTGSPVIQCYAPSPDYTLTVLGGGDCNDNDPLQHPGQKWYADIDHDGHGDLSNFVTQCTRPADGWHYAASELLGLDDCDDHNTAEPVTYYKDADGDGYGNPAVKTYSCNPDITFGYVTNSLDCNDNDASVNPNTVWYKDADGDGYTDGTTLGPQCERPTGYKLLSEIVKDTYSNPVIDCDDNDASVNPGIVWYKDADNDNYTDGTTLTQCYRPAGYKLFSEIARDLYGNPFIDCDDNDPTLSTAYNFYFDGDHDGFGDPTNYIHACRNSTPKGYVNNGDDCDDENYQINPTTIWYKDADNDGYSDGTTLGPQCGRPTGYKLASELTATTGDCDDGNAAINPTTIWYKDADNDGYSDGTTLGPQCERPTGYKTASELKGISGDCDDNNGALKPTVWYRDADGDGYGDMNNSIANCYAPDGYVSNHLDCDDNNASLPKLYYPDADGDGYGYDMNKDPGNTCFAWTFDQNSGKVTISLIGGRGCGTPPAGPIFSCLPPPGYAANGDDCNDNDASIAPNITWYKDADNDGYSDGSFQEQCTRPPGYKLASELIATNGDCDDNDASINPGVVWYRDADGDGYGDPNTSTQSCTQPTGYVLNNVDCDDTKAFVNITKVWYRDADGDGFGDQNTITISCTQPAGYVLNLSDCDDTRADINPNTVWYRDADGDGFGDPNTITESCIQPTGYVSNNGDCDDTKAAINPSTVWYRDADGDGFGNPNITTQSCTQPTGYVLNNTDCDDTKAAINPSTVWYRDADGDGYGNPNITTQSCTQPTGYVSNNTDCDDTKAAINPNTVWYKDGDGDGFGDPNITTQSCTQPTGYVSNNTDCDDTKAAINPNTVWYKDGDGDGFGNPNITTQSCTQPTGYVLNNTDCDDTKAAINPATVWYKDADGDNYSDGTTKMQCARPAGYKLASELTATSIDCNDNDPTVHSPQIYYRDADGDGYGNPSVTTSACSSTPPAGYVSNKLDCNDNDPAISPAAVEVCGNKVDDNCNGVVDEKTCYACTNGTNFTTTNITSTSAQVNWKATANPQQWQLEYKSISPGSPWTDVLLTGNIRSAKLSLLKAKQTYNCHVRAKCNGTWTSYSNAIAFTTLASSATVSSLTAATIDNSLRIYPDPNKGQFVVELNLVQKINAKAQIQLIDMTGKTVQLENAVVNNGSLQKTIIASSSLTQGVYMVRILVNDKVYKTQMVLAK
jgi:hypothetical protein